MAFSQFGQSRLAISNATGADTRNYVLSDGVASVTSNFTINIQP